MNLDEQTETEVLDEQPEVAVEDEAAEDVEADFLPVTYRIVAYGADFDVTSLVKRLDNEDIEMPNFQRGFVWTYRQASRFVESLLLGFPVPGIFLWRNPATEKLVIVDGQQRLRTLQSFYREIFKDRVFVLPEKTSPYQQVHPRFQKRTYQDLEEDDRRRLDNSIIHATIVQQERPPGDDSSIFYLFERINTEGTPLQPQEIRAAIYQGPLIDLLGDLNRLPEWRAIYGSESQRMKDRELILRFFALHYALGDYARPMKEFLNRYCARNRDLTQQSAEELADLFNDTIGIVAATIGDRAFRPEKALNAAVFDAVMVGTARHLQERPINDSAAYQAAYASLLSNQEFIDSYTRATADAESVRRRLELATEAFAQVE